MIEGIASASMALSQIKVEQAVSVSLLKDAMDNQSTEMDALLRNMEASFTGLGQNIDLMA